jgi:hypothetical protein
MVLGRAQLPKEEGVKFSGRDRYQVIHLMDLRIIF